MRLKLPPLKTLNSFIVCAKNQSFTKTAAELQLTQGAISKQISLLENYLGLQLFERKGQSLKLTSAAEIYLKKIENALENIESATSEIIKNKNSAKQKESLNINILPSMGSIWLTPLLQSFKNKFPQYDVVLKIGDGAVDFNNGGYDLAIRVSKEKKEVSWGNFKTNKIMDETLLCVCSPKFKEECEVKEVKDLFKHNLLGHTCRPEIWQEYLSSFGFKKSHIHHSNSFEHFFLLIEALKNDMGFGLVPEFLIRKELKSRELVLAIQSKFESPYGYFLLHRKQNNIPKKITDFTSWIKEAGNKGTLNRFT